MNEDDLIKKRLGELAEKSFKSNCFSYTDFLGMSELAVFYENERALKYACPNVFGGHEGFERGIVRFGNPDEFGYEEPWPVALIKISPAAEKFADDLGHRDFLGALMSMGVERSVIGDIVVDGKCAYVFCLDRIADFLCDGLISVRHTTVHAEKTEISEVPVFKENAAAEKRIQVSSERIDAVIAHVLNISRSASLELFRQQKVFVNGRVMENTSYLLKNEDAVTVRGFGRFRFDGVESVSRKGKLNVIITV